MKTKKIKLSDLEDSKELGDMLDIHISKEKEGKEHLIHISIGKFDLWLYDK